MTLEELQARRNHIDNAANATLSNMEVIRNETVRVQKVAHNAEGIFRDIEAEFEKQTKLNRVDQAFLFLAIGLQFLRVYLVNKATDLEKAGKGEKEDKLHKIQEKILGKFDNGEFELPKTYYAPLNQIITGRGVPYDATAFLGEHKKIFKGANHRFSTLAHDPIVGLVIGTTNILTNTITCVETLPVILTKHVVYDDFLKNPKIDYVTPASTIIALKEGFSRLDGDVESVVAAIIKQIIHIGTDMYTPCGIQLPFANLVLDKTTVEKVTKYVSTGDVVKIGSSYVIATAIDFIITTVHTLLYDEKKCESKDLYNLKTRKIIRYSYAVVTGSNVLVNAMRIYGGDVTALKTMDIAGVIKFLKHLSEDRALQIKIKEEFVLGHFDKLIQGEELSLQNCML